MRRDAFHERHAMTVDVRGFLTLVKAKPFSQVMIIRQNTTLKMELGGRQKV